MAEEALIQFAPLLERAYWATDTYSITPANLKLTRAQAAVDALAELITFVLNHSDEFDAWLEEYASARKKTHDQ